MRTAYLQCFAVIALSFLAVRAGAQCDSVNVTFDFLSGGDTYVQTTDYDPSNHTASGPRVEVKVTATVEVTLKIAFQNDSISFFDSLGNHVSFVIDSVNSSFRKLAIAASEGTINGGEGMLSYNAYFDSIPFTRTSQGNLEFQGNVWDNDDHYAGGISGTDETVNPGAHYVGFFSGSGGGAEPSLNIEISHLNSSASSVQLIAIPHLDLGWDLTLNSITLVSSELPRVLEISDLLGRSANIPIPANSESTCPQNSLPPGLYFARLGDQVAKFIVPPR